MNLEKSLILFKRHLSQLQIDLLESQREQKALAKQLLVQTYKLSPENPTESPLFQDLQSQKQKYYTKYKNYKSQYPKHYIQCLLIENQDLKQTNSELKKKSFDLEGQFELIKQELDQNLEKRLESNDYMAKSPFGEEEDLPTAIREEDEEEEEVRREYARVRRETLERMERKAEREKTEEELREEEGERREEEGERRKEEGRRREEEEGRRDEEGGRREEVWLRKVEELEREKEDANKKAEFLIEELNMVSTQNEELISELEELKSRLLVMQGGE